MVRRADALLAPETAFNDQSNAPMANLVGSGQMGIVTDLSTFISNAAHVRRNIIAVVIQTPRGFNDLPESEAWHANCKALLEVHSRTIEGLRSTLTAEFVSNPIGAAGEQQEDISKVSRERSSPTHSFVEKYGKPINRFFDGWIRYLMADPETGVPAITSINDDVSDLLPDYTGATVLYFEPDPLHKTVVEAWLCTNMMPKTAGQVEGSRDITQAGQSVEYSIEFTCIQQVGAGVKAFAQQILDGMNLSGTNPNRRNAHVQEISADVARGENGYAEVLGSLANDQI